MNEYQTLWNDTLDKLKSNLAESTFQQTFSEVKYVIKEENNIIYVKAPSTFIKSKINSIYVNQIAEILSSLTTKKMKFKFVTEDELTVNTPKNFVGINQVSNLNQNYTFESFVTGESNRISYITAMKVAEAPGQFINPLYIFGGVGLGKTHLMQAIGNYISETDLDNKVLYVQANEYIEDYGKATRDNNLKDFEKKYENLDVLLVDDIQMLSKGKASQEEFFKLFNNMVNRSKQIVITSDCPASQLSGLMDRLTSRFQMGMTVDIKQPDLNQRLNILKRKLQETSQIEIDDDILYYIAENFTDNVRQLEGALTRLCFVAEVYNTKPTMQMAVTELEILMKPTKNKNQNYDEALGIIANMYNIPEADLLGKSRNSKYVTPRHIAMYVLKTHYKLTYAKIGSLFNGRDHTTVMNGCTKIENEIKTNEQVRMAIETILKKI